jgi:hypothetical protein
MVDRGWDSNQIPVRHITESATLSIETLLSLSLSLYIYIYISYIIYNVACRDQLLGNDRETTKECPLLSKRFLISNSSTLIIELQQ